MTQPSAGFIRAMRAIWDTKYPATLRNSELLSNLVAVCRVDYALESDTYLPFALHNAIRTLGTPCLLPQEKQHLAIPVDDASIKLHAALSGTGGSRIHFCPLDCADDLPKIEFGPGRIDYLHPTELRELLRVDQLERLFPSWVDDTKRLAKFRWLIVREEVTWAKRPGERAYPFFYHPIDLELGSIEPHPQRYPEMVERAISALLMAPWEDLVQQPDINWRPFHIPWIYTIDDDIMTHRTMLPSAESLSWEPDIYQDDDGSEIEQMRPCTYHLLDVEAALASSLNSETWNRLSSARDTFVYSDPAAHFLNRAFRSSGIDEFLAHITTIESGLGSALDHYRKGRPKIRWKHNGATARVGLRLSALLNDASCYADYENLFNARSDFIHGRSMQKISAADGLLARRLARRMFEKLVSLPNEHKTLQKAVFLQMLLDQGCDLLSDSHKGEPE